MKAIIKDQQCKDEIMGELKAPTLAILMRKIKEYYEGLCMDALQEAYRMDKDIAAFHKGLDDIINMSAESVLSDMIRTGYDIHFTDDE